MADTLDTLVIELESNAGDAYQGLDKFAASLENVGKSFSRIDIGKVNSLSTSLGNLGNSIATLAGAVNSLDMSKLTGSFKGLNSVIDKETNRLMEQFGVKSKQAGTQLRTALLNGSKALTQSSTASEEYADELDLIANGSNAAAEAIRAGTDALANNAKTSNSARAAYKDLLEDMKAVNEFAKIHIPQEVVSDLNGYGYNFNKVRSTLGKGFTSGAGDSDIENFISERNSEWGNIIDTSKSVSEQVMQLYDILAKARGVESGEQKLSEYGNSLAEVETAVEQAMQRVADARQQAASGASEEVSPFSGLKSSIDEVTESIKAKTKALGEEVISVQKGIPTEVENFRTLKSVIESIGKAYASINQTKNGQTVGGNIENVGASASSIDALLSAAQKLGEVQFDTSGIVGLTDALSKFGNGNIQKATATMPFLAQSLFQLANTLNGIQSINFDPTGITNLIASISKLGSGSTVPKAVASLPQLASGINDLIASVSKMQGANFDFAWMQSLAEALRVMGSATALRAAENLDQLGDAMVRLMQTLSTAPQVSQNLIQMTQAMAQLAANGSRVTSATNALIPTFPRLNSGMKSARGHAFSLASAFGKLYATYWLLLRAIRMVKGWVDLASSLTEIQNVVDHTFGNMQSRLNDFTQDSIQKFGMSELSAKQAATRYQSMGVAMGITGGMVKNANANLERLGKTMYSNNASLADMSVNLTKLVADYASFYDMDQKEVAEKFNAIYTGQTRPLTLAA